jgi:biopolymer transport protein ExbB
MAQNSSGVIEISTLSEGMYQAMVTTVGGLIVGILAMFAYNFLVSRIDRVVRQLEARTMEFMDLLNEPV